MKLLRIAIWPAAFAVVLLLAFGVARAQAPQSSIEFLTPPPPPVTTVTAQQTTGTAGGGTYYYWVIARYPAGNAVPAGPAEVLRAGVVGLANNITVRWNPLPGTTGYDVLRTTIPTLPMTGTGNMRVALAAAAPPVVDNIVAPVAYTITSAQERRASVRLDNRAYAAPVLRTDTAAALPVLDRGGAAYNVKGYGACGDGICDDTAAIQAAVCAMPTAGGTAFVPASTGSYVLTGNITDCAKTSVQIHKASGAVISGAFTILNAPNDGLGQAVIYDSGPASSGTTIHDALRVVIGNTSLADDWGANTVRITEALVGAAAAPAGPSSSVMAIGVTGIATTADPNQGAVGVLASVLPKVAGPVTSVFGFNAIYSNCPYALSSLCPGQGLQDITAYGMELNPGLYTLPGGGAPNSAMRGLFIIGAGNTGTGNPIFNAVDIESPGYYETPKVKWANALYTNDGAAVVGLNLGALTVGDGYGSQPIWLRGKTAGGTPTLATLATNASGALIMSSGSGNFGFQTDNPGAAGDFGGTDLGGAVSTEVRAGNAANNSGFRIGQDATHNAFWQWKYNATPGSAYVSLSTWGGNNNLVLQEDGGSVAIGGLGGSGVGYVCVDADNKLYRSAAACVP